MDEDPATRTDEALRMLQVFTSVGAEHFDITHINLDGEKRAFRPAQSLEQTSRSMPHLIASAAIRRNNVIIRPHSRPPVLLIQLDDLDQGQLEQVRPVAFLTLLTSPGNYQAWVAVQDAGTDLARRLRKGTGADLTASGATRVAGSTNFKRKYQPDFPTVAIVEAAPGRIVTAAQLEALGLLAAPDPVKETFPAVTFRVSGRRGKGKWPSYARCLEGAPPAHNSDRPDISRADFTWCMLAADWGFSVEETAARLMQESTKARENGPRYAEMTARRAAEAVQRREQRR